MRGDKKEEWYCVKLSKIDLKLVGLACFLFGLFIAGLLPSAVLKSYWALWLIVAILVIIKPVYSYFKK